ncbi:MAG: InlB B-repeat-containing protein [Oscillospiraceae bacterium]|nr:InlB B-repeat-containing protein [Oscillospiraceae bacterium]
MKQRIKGLVSLWLAVLLLVGNVASAASGVLAEYVRYYDGEETLEVGTYLYEGYTELSDVEYGDDAATLAEQLGSHLEIPDGMEHTGWNFWLMNDCGAIISGPEEKATDATLAESDASALSYSVRLLITPLFAAKTYTVTWNNHDGNELEVDHDVAYGATPEYNGATPEKAADDDYTYTFDNWSPSITPVTGDATYTAVFTSTPIVRHTVTFETNGGSAISDVQVKDGEVLSVPTAPTKSGHTFKGWYKDAGLSAEYDFSLPVNENFTLYAKWELAQSQYTVTWNNHDGNELEVDHDVAYGATPEYNGATPEKAADDDYTYTFDGWSPSVTPVTGDVTYTAVFTSTPIVRHTITFETNGGSAISDAQVKDGEVLSVPTAPTKSGYTFKGWYKDVGLSAEYDFSLPVNENFTLYAKWEKKTNSGGGGGGGITLYVVRFETNGGSKVPNAAVVRKAKLTRPANPTKDGFTFGGWYADTALETPYDFNTAVTSNFTLYAKWNSDSTVSDLLNTAEHSAYVFGYQDRTVRPEDNITRAETAEIFFRLLNAETRAKYLSEENGFADVPASAWYHRSVSTMEKLGILKGRTDTEFVPNAWITRAEFAAICARFDASKFEETQTFTDIEGHWAEEEILEAAAHGWICGYEDGSFRPEAPITRAEAITLINRMLERTPKSKESLHVDMVTWLDNSDEDAWYYLAIQEATNDHEYTKNVDGSETWSRVNQK